MRTPLDPEAGNSGSAGTEIYDVQGVTVVWIRVAALQILDLRQTERCGDFLDVLIDKGRGNPGD